MGRYTDALRVVQRVRLDCDDVPEQIKADALSIQGDCYARLNQYSAAIATLDLLKRRFGRIAGGWDVRADCQLGDTFHRFGRLAQAKSVYQGVIRQHPDSPLIPQIVPALKRVDSQLHAVEDIFAIVKQQSGLMSLTSQIWTLTCIHWDDGEALSYLPEETLTNEISMTMDDIQSMLVRTSQLSAADLRHLAEMYSRVAYLCFLRNDMSKAWMYQESSLELCERLCDGKLLSMCWGRLGTLLIWQAAHSAANRAVFDELGSISSEMIVPHTTSSGISSWSMGPPMRYLSRATKAFEKQHVIGSTMGDVFALCQSAFGVALVCWTGLHVVETAVNPSIYRVPNMTTNVLELRSVCDAFKSANVALWADCLGSVCNRVLTYAVFITGHCRVCSPSDDKKQCAHEVLEPMMNHAVWFR
jgi:hypothetical protein